MIAVLVSLAAATQAPPATTLAECTFQLPPWETSGGQGGALPFALLFEAPLKGQSSIASVRVHDPKRILRGLPVTRGFYSNGRKILSFRTDKRQPVYFRIGFLSGQSGWAGVIQLDGVATEDQRLAASYMGQCTIAASADVAARFEALEAKR
jgi:hypothetical protein